MIAALTITRAGIDALIAAKAAGGVATISQIAIGHGVAPTTAGDAGAGYAVTGEETALRHEIERQSVEAAGAIGTMTWRLSVIFSGLAQGWINEIGLYLDSGTLFAVGAAEGSPALYKPGGGVAALTIDFSAEGLPAGGLAVQSTRALETDTLGALARNAAETLRVQRRFGLDPDAARLVPIIQATWG